LPLSPLPSLFLLPQGKGKKGRGKRDRQ
jgi:hypothetical protein